MALSDLVVRQSKATGRGYSVAEQDGLALRVSPQSGKCWHFRYYWAGKQKCIREAGGGSIINISSAAARFAQKNFSTYGPAKAVLNHRSRNLAQDCAST